MQVLDKGSVSLLTHMGSDLTVVNAARVSFNKRARWGEDPNGEHRPGVLAPADVKLIRYLAKHEHWTPFGHPQLQFHMKMPIFCARQFMRSNVGIVYNEVSRRYVDEPPEFYEPKEWRARPDKSLKQGSSSETVKAPYIVGLAQAYALDAYKDCLEAGIAPEMARMVLPLSTYTEFWATMSLAACARVVKLRADPHAQWEIRQYADAISGLVKPHFPVSWDALQGVPHD